MNSSQRRMETQAEAIEEAVSQRLGFGLYHGIAAKLGKGVSVILIHALDDPRNLLVAARDVPFTVMH
jgi:hypothetical protein